MTLLVTFIPSKLSAYKITYKDFQEYFEKLHGRKMDRNDLWEYLTNESSKDSFIDLDKYQNSSSWN